MQEMFDEIELSNVKRAFRKLFESYVDLNDPVIEQRDNGENVEHDTRIMLRNAVVIHLVRDSYARSIVLQEYDKLNEEQQLHIQQYTANLSIWPTNFNAEETLALLKLHALLHEDKDNKTLEKLIKKAFNKLVRIVANMKDFGFQQFEQSYGKHSKYTEFEFTTAIYYRLLKGNSLVIADDFFVECYYPDLLAISKLLFANTPLVANWLEHANVKESQVETAKNELTDWFKQVLGLSKVPKDLEINAILSLLQVKEPIFGRTDLIRLYFNEVTISDTELLNLYVNYREEYEDNSLEKFSVHLITYFIERYNREQIEHLYSNLEGSLNQSPTVGSKYAEEQIQQVIASREGVISSLEQKLAKTEKAYADKLEVNARSYQALERKYKELQKEIDDTTDLKREVQIHRNNLYEQMIEVDADETMPVDQTDYVQLLKDMDVTLALFGGYPSFRQNWKETFGKNIRLVGTRDYYVDLKFINNVDVILFDGKYNNHGLFENVMAALKSDEPIFKLLRTGRSMNLICKDIYMKLTNSKK